MHCESCDWLDENETWGSKCHCDYLKAYVYPDDTACSHYRKRGSSSGGCYLTTACCEYRHLPDDCRELTAMRRLRDEYLSRSGEGRRLVADYYRTAPTIVARIDASPERDVLYDYIYGVASDCAALVDRGDYESAKGKYLEMVERLEDVLSQAA
ncbi:MAG: hypothetical protein IKG18_17575 [Atopobiaceae bacterium]|nr:hypothetical protein [Atopobiaceae bacterium]